MRLLKYESFDRVVTITIQKDSLESASAIEAKLRMKYPQLNGKIVKSWIDLDENQQVFIFVAKENEKNPKTRQLLLD